LDDIDDIESHPKQSRFFYFLMLSCGAATRHGNVAPLAALGHGP
jgi:hypothetical protein